MATAKRLKKAAKPKPVPVSESPQDFESVARRLECDPDLKKFDAKLRKIAKAKPVHHPKAK